MWGEEVLAETSRAPRETPGCGLIVSSAVWTDGLRGPVHPDRWTLGFGSLPAHLQVRACVFYLEGQTDRTL